MSTEKKNSLMKEVLFSEPVIKKKITHVKIQFENQLKGNIIFIWKYRFKYNLALNNIESEMDYYNNLIAQ